MWGVPLICRWFSIVLLVVLAVMASKRQKTHDERTIQLASLGRASFASRSAIAGLLKGVREDGLPDACSRRSQYRARKDTSHTSTPYGEIVVQVPVALEKGGSIDLGFQNPLAFFAYHCSESPHYARIVADALEKKPCTAASPWRIILYQDGVNPSDGLAKCHSRKSVVFYWAFAEFGLRALAHEEVWGTVTVTRLNQANKLEGRIAQLTTRVLELFFGQVHDIRRSGVSVVIRTGAGDVRATIFAIVGVMLADDPAIKEMLECKGHSGNKCCCLCLDACLVNSQGTPLHEVSDYATPISATTLDSFKKHTDESIRQLLIRLKQHHDNLIARRITKEAYEAKSMVLGYNWTPYNIILNEKFRIQVASCVMFDWGHTYVCDGLGDTEFGMCMQVLHRHRLPSTYAECGEYVNTFTTPKSAPDVSKLFSESANRNNVKKGSFSCTASEFLTLAPILCRYFTNVVAARDQCMDVVRSFQAVLWVIVLLQAIKSCDVNPELLAFAICEHFRLFLLAYGEDNVRPKHHYAIHLPDMLRRFGFLLSTFTHERKHKVIKRYTRDRSNLTQWDIGSIEEITCHQMWELRQPFFMSDVESKPVGRVLLSLRELFPMVPDDAMSLHNKVKCNGGCFSMGDVVSCTIDGEPQVCEVVCTVGLLMGGVSSMVSVLALWGKSERATNGWLHVNVSDDNIVKLNANSVDTVLTYRMSADRSCCSAYLPYELRR